MKRFDGKVVLVTGAASGFGRRAAQRFAEEGASVVAADVSEEGLSRAGDAEGVSVVRADVSSTSSRTVRRVPSSVRWTRRRLG